MKIRRLWIIVAVFLMVGTAIAGKSRKSIDQRADAAKALQLAETGTTMMGNNLLGAAMMLMQADTLNGTDPVIEMAVNNFFLLLMPHDNSRYYSQLELLENTPDAPRSYYYSLVEAYPAKDAELDTMEYFNMAVRAHRRFPQDGYFAESLLRRGVTYLYNKRFRESIDGESVDTLDLSAESIAFADTLLNWGNVLEKTIGYSLEIDRSRGAIWKILDRKDELRNLAKSLEGRDSTDIELLDLRTSLAYTLGDSLQVYELGIKRFDMNPDGEHVYSLYNAMPNDTLRAKLSDAVIAKASDTDIDPYDRMEVLRALAEVYYHNNEDIEEPVEVLDRISNAVEEICAEDPTDRDTYLKGTALTLNRHWLSNYGYRHWVNAVKNLTDEEGELEDVAEALVPIVENKPEFEDGMLSLIDYYSQNDKIYLLNSKIALAQYYFNSELYRESLDILQSITLAGLQEDYRRIKEAQADETEEEEIEDNQLSRFVAIQSMISDCQIKLGMVDEALATLNHVITLDPSNATALNNLAYYMCENGRDLTIALTLVERSLTLEPDNLNAIDTRAWILFNRGDYEGALKDMHKFFETLEVEFDALVDAENEQTVNQIFDDANINAEMVAPIVGHLLRILSKQDEISEDSLKRLADFVSEKDPDNEDLQIYLKNKR